MCMRVVSPTLLVPICKIFLFLPSIVTYDIMLFKLLYIVEGKLLIIAL